MLSGLRRLFTTRNSPQPRPAASGASPHDAPGTLINAYATVRETPPLSFAHTLHSRRDRSDPDLAPHLRGFSGYVSRTGDAQMTSARFHLLGHIGRVRQQVSLSVEDKDLEAFTHWAEKANAVLFLPDGTVRDPAFRVLARQGTVPPDPQAQLPYPAEAQQRKERTMALLSARGLHAMAHLPPREAESEAVLRTADEVLVRAWALLAVAVRAESLHTGDPLPVATLRERLPDAFAHLSPLERAFLGEDAPDPKAIVQFAWRYEGVRVLEWALGLAADLPFPSAICDASLVTRTLLDRPRRPPALRPMADILDALDLTLRLNWIARQARLGGQAPVDGLDAGVVQERHVVLNWIVNFQDADWDQVDTPT